jgi:Ni,Fe-hydrogenase III component G
MAEEKIKAELEQKFPFLKDNIAVKRERRIFVEVPYAEFPEVLNFCINLLNFTMLANVIGSDDGEELGAMYNLDNRNGVLLNLRIKVPRARPVIRTITNIFPNSEIYERELVDLFGIQVEGLSPGPRYPLPDNWPAGEYPLRKDWKGCLPETCNKEVNNA